MDNNRNYFIAIALSVLVLVAWQFFYVSPRIEKERAALEQSQPTVDGTTAAQGEGDLPATGPSASTSGSGDLPGASSGAATNVPSSLSREAALAQNTRIAIDTPSLVGSINLTGARLDDLKLKKYRETVDDNSPIISLLNPAGLSDAYFAEIGYIGNELSGDVPGPSTPWTASQGTTLTQESPIVLTWENDKGLTFTRTVSVDADYMFTYEDTIANASGATVSLSKYGRITRFAKPTTASFWILHEGLIGVIGENGLQEIDYDDVESDGTIKVDTATAGWLGITDKFWAAALVPTQGKEFDTRYSYFSDGTPRYQSDFRSSPITLDDGANTATTARVFAGAKQVPIINGYEAAFNIPQFELLIDWGWFYFITKPLFWLIDFFFKQFGNFGVAILLTTVVVKLLFFPLANKSYVSMANMKKVQPKMEELKAKHGDDRAALQQGMMELYKKEKINPIAGCWPVLLQIPVFFALYKVLFVTIEMRHAPFFGWIQDLSAPDPTSLFNLFGLLPYDVPAFLLIGVWPLIMGVTMFLQMRMNPTPPDPTQAMIFTWMPVVFTFMLATFPAGLVIYWAWNNTLSILQQGVIMKRQGAKIELWDNLMALFKRKPKAAE